MGKTFRRNDRWKKDRRDKDFQKSKKFKEINRGHYPHKPSDVPQTDDIEDYDTTGNISVE